MLRRQKKKITVYFTYIFKKWKHVSLITSDISVPWLSHNVFVSLFCLNPVFWVKVPAFCWVIWFLISAFLPHLLFPCNLIVDKTTFAVSHSLDLGDYIWWVWLHKFLFLCFHRSKGLLRFSKMFWQECEVVGLYFLLHHCGSQMISNCLSSVFRFFSDFGCCCSDNPLRRS